MRVTVEIRIVEVRHTRLTAMELDKRRILNSADEGAGTAFVDTQERWNLAQRGLVNVEPVTRALSYGRCSHC